DYYCSIWHASASKLF
nr:immunoglobulin light chain junction region [Macaca mulatta]MOX29217.1 immunoglobulin light chain junction region [Macaca mulatta]